MTSLSGYENYKSVRHFGSLDALRCFAIIGVVWQHCPPIPHEAAPFTNPGASGVGLFFVLSGFLITTLLLREESATGRISLRNFYARRILRIFPLYYAVLAAYTILVLTTEHNAAGRLFLHNLPYYITYTSNWFVDLIINEDGQRRVIFVFAWTLATEEQFYMIWPSVMKYCRRRVAVALVVSTIIVDLALTIAFPAAEAPSTVFERLLRIATSPATEICLGVLLAIGMHSRAQYSRLWRLLGHSWSAPVFALLAVAVAVWPGEISIGWRVASAVAFTLLIGACTIREDHGLAWLLQVKWLSRIGVVSYGMYMLHMLSVNVVRVVSPRLGVHSDALVFAMALTLTFLVAETSFRLYESPILRLKSRFQSQRGSEARRVPQPERLPPIS